MNNWLIKYFSLFCISGISLQLFSQNVNISGKIFDKESNKGIDAAVIHLNPDKLTFISTVNGEYSFSCKPGRKEILVKILGYKPTILNCNIRLDTTINISLEILSYKLNEVTVTDDSIKSIKISDHGSFIMSPASIYETPKHFSEPDLIKSLQLLPGVVAGRDGSTEMYVRGGNAGQNVVLANGCYFFLPSHLLGLISPYDLDFIERSELIKDYFPAELGGGASSVIKLDYQKQNSDSLGIKLRLGLLSSGVTFNIPLRKINWGLSLGLKRGNYSLYSSLLEKIVHKDVGSFLPPDNYSFYDGYLRLTHSSTQWGNISYLFIGNYDKGNQKSEVDSHSADTLIKDISGIITGWRSVVHAIHWDLPFKRKTKWQLDLNYNKLSENRDNYLSSEKYLNESSLIDSRETSYKFSPSITNFGTTLSLSRSLGTFTYSLGFYDRIRYFAPNIIATDIYNDINTKNSFGGNYFITEPALFVTSEYRYLKKIKFNGGLRFSGGFTSNAGYLVIEPRIRITLNPDNKLSPHFNYVRISQFDHSVESSNVGLRSMLWLPASKEFGPEISDVVSLGLLGHINDKYIWIIDGYFKTISGMVDFKSGATFLFDNSFKDLLDRIKGRAYGLETYFIKKTGKLTGSLSYTWSRSKREWGATEGLIWIPSNSDRPHNANISLKYSFAKKMSFGLTWIYLSGTPATLYIHESIIGEWYETKNNIRYPDYSRLDLSLRRSFHLKRFDINVDADVYNVYNRKNTFYLEYRMDNLTGRYYYRNVALFPIMPSLTVTINYK